MEKANGKTWLPQQQHQNHNNKNNWRRMAVARGHRDTVADKTEENKS